METFKDGRDNSRLNVKLHSTNSPILTSQNVHSLKTFLLSLNHRATDRTVDIVDFLDLCFKLLTKCYDVFY